MGKVKQTRRKLAQFFNWRVSVTLTDGRVLVGTLMAVDRHVNLVLCNTEEYRRYKVKGKPEGKELKRMLGFIVCRGNGVLYVQPEEVGKEELVETDKPRKVKAATKAAPAAGGGNQPAKAAPAVLPTGLLQGLQGLRPPGLTGMPGMPGFSSMPNAGLLAATAGRGAPLMPGLPQGLPGLGSLPGLRPPGMPSMPTMPGMPPQMNLQLLQQMGAKAGMPGLH